MSLQTGAELAQTREAIVDPRQLAIVALYVDGPLLDHSPAVLHTADIRELSDIGCIVNDSVALMPLDGLVRLQEVVALGFTIFGIPVYDEAGHKLGKVEGITFEPTSYTIQQLLTRQSLLQSLSTAAHIIHRSQIVTVTNEYIVVRDATVTDRVSSRLQRGAELINPFKKPQAEHRKDTE